ncbi:MAG TPA: winged helix-turn-helix domain-containing protein [Terriglobia bacterium]|nr:winged helix-turn-helix domain-containing protein [Terriglobia bacterium]
MEINGKVGEAAGKVWQALSSEGPQTVSQLKTKLNGSSEVVNFALGWLAREDKVEIEQVKKSFKVKLK